MDRETVKKVLLEHGFTLKPQANGTMDLHDYVYKAVDALIDTTFEGFEQQGRRLYQTCVSRGATPGKVLRWLTEQLDSKVQTLPKYIRHCLFQYDSGLFVAFDPTDDGSSIVGAYRTPEEAEEAIQRHCRLHGDGPGADDPICLPNMEAMEKLLKEAWNKGCECGERQSTAGHSAGYQVQDCQSDVERMLLTLRPKKHG